MILSINAFFFLLLLRLMSCVLFFLSVVSFFYFIVKTLSVLFICFHSSIIQRRPKSQQTPQAIQTKQTNTIFHTFKNLLSCYLSIYLSASIGWYTKKGHPSLGLTWVNNLNTWWRPHSFTFKIHKYTNRHDIEQRLECLQVLLIFQASHDNTKHAKMVRIFQFNVTFKLQLIWFYCHCDFDTVLIILKKFASQTKKRVQNAI